MTDRGGIDGLLTPSMQGQSASASRPAPWELGSQFYVAFFGGPLAVTAIAIANAWRLGLARKALYLIGAVGAVAFVVSLVVASLVPTDSPDSARNLRIATQLVGVIGWGGQFLVQRSADRVFSSFDERERDSLWIPGIAAVVGGAIVHFIAVELVV